MIDVRLEGVCRFANITARLRRANSVLSHCSKEHLLVRMKPQDWNGRLSTTVLRVAETRIAGQEQFRSREVVQEMMSNRRRPCALTSLP
jgi:hypothetical protein